jgi:hypothetical protein
MSKASNSTNRFTEEALQYIEEIVSLQSAYEAAKRRDVESQELFRQAEVDVMEVLNDRNSDVSDCAEKLVLAQAKRDVLKHRLSSGGDNSVAATLVDLATAVDQAAGFTMGAGGYIARTIRQRKIKEIAAELGLAPGKVNTDEITVRLHPIAVAAENLSVTRISQFMELDRVTEASALQHAAGVLLKLRRLAVFEFEDIDDSPPKPTGDGE